MLTKLVQPQVDPMDTSQDLCNQNIEAFQDYCDIQEQKSKEPPTKKAKKNEMHARNGRRQVVHRFRPDWKNEFPWIKASPKGVHYFFCTACNKNLKVGGGHSHVVNHSTSKVHKKKESAYLQHSIDVPCEDGKTEATSEKSDPVAHTERKQRMGSENESANSSPRDCRSFIESYEPDIADQAISEQIIYEASDSSFIMHKVTRSSDSPTPQTKGKSSMPVTDKAAIIGQISEDFEDTVQKIKVCEEELSSLKVRKARLEYEFEFYNTNL